MMKEPRLRAWRLARAARRAERQTALSAAAPGTPAIAAKADDLEEIKKSVEDAASVSGGLWLSYLFVLFYIAIAAGAVTHEDLLLERSVKLPFLNVELPLLAFFALAPYIVLIIHAYALLHFIMLGKKASRFHAELKRQFPDAVDGAGLPSGAHKDIRDKLRRLLPSNIFVQILAGPPELRTGIFGTALKLIALSTLVIFPVLVLLLLQIQFLPFHDTRITWAQRGALFFDIVVLWLLRPPILSDLSVESSGNAQLFSRALGGFVPVLASVMSIAVIWFSIVVATIPGEWRTFPLYYVAAIEPEAVNKLVFGVVAPEKDIITGNWPSNTLRLQGFDIYEALKVDDLKKLDWKDHIFDLHSRRLEGAVFDSAKLGRVDLKEAHLEGASMRGSNLRGASLDGAYLQGASLLWAQLQGASLLSANLQGALLQYVQLQGASLKRVSLQGLSLFEAQLQGASLEGAELQGASLSYAQLQGASLNGAGLEGASLYYAQLQGASLINAVLNGAALNEAQLQGASLDGASLQGASLDSAQLQGASLDQAQLRGASLDRAQLQGASLAYAAVNAADFSEAFLWRAKWGAIEDRELLGAVRLDAASERWKPVWQEDIKPSPVPWDAKTYAKLRVSMNSIPEGRMRDEALVRIESLDCGNPDKRLASCDPAAKPLGEVLDWQKKLKAASADCAAYTKALATELRNLVCISYLYKSYILQGVIDFGRLAHTGREAPALVEFIMSKDCPVSASLTNDDKAKLLRIKQDAEQIFPPPAASQKAK
jgi:uncharacterized protein YjbI with pentapeptide repeats